MNLLCLSRITAQHVVKGGMEIHLKMLAEGLVKNGHTVRVLTTRRSDGLVGEETIEGVIYQYTDTAHSNYFSKWYPLWYSDSSLIIDQLHEKEAIDIVWAEGGGAYGAVKALKRLGIPYVPIAQGTIPGDLSSYFRQIKTPLDVAKFIFWFGIKKYWQFRYELPYIRDAAKMIVVSNELKRDVEKFYGIASEHIEVIFNGVAQEHFFVSSDFRSEIRERFHIPIDALVLFCAGRLIREKGFHVVIEAVSRLKEKFPNLYLFMSGKGKYEEILRELSMSLKVDGRVIFTGFVEYSDIPKYYNASDIFVSPTFRVEGFPLTFAEAMLCGLPIIASDLGGNPSAVRDNETGFLLYKRSVDELVEKLDALLADQPLRQTFSHNALNLAQKEFTQKVMVKRTEEIFRRIINNQLSITNQ